MILGTINCQKLSLNSTDIVADTIDFIEARFVFLSDDWDGLEKWAHFARDSEVYDIRLTDDHIRKEDHLNLSAGKWKVYIHGNEFRGGEVVQRITTDIATLYVEPTGTLDGEPFPEMPASVTEQILARLDDIEQNGGGSGGGISRETDPTVPDWAKQQNPPTYTATDVGALPANTPIPAKTSELVNDSGYITIAVATLLNYYLKTEVYNKFEAYSRSEVDNLIGGLDKRLNAVADSEDIDLDQLSEIVAYIKSNKSLIDSITTSKVSIADIIDNLTTADAKKPLSAAQGKALKEMYDTLPAWAKAASKPTYTKSEVGLGNVDNVRQYSAQNPPPYPVTSVNGMTGAVMLNASHVRARPETWMPSASEVGADPSGTADSKVSAHNVSETSHNDIRLLITGLTNRLNALANSTDDDLDQLAEIVAYIKANKSLIDGITTSKVSVVDIIDNLTTNASNKPLSAKMGVQLKALIDAIKIPTSLPASDVYAWAKEPQKPTYTAPEVGAATKKQVDDLSKMIADYRGQLDGKQPVGDYLTEVPDEYVTETELTAGIDDLKAQGVQQTPLFANSTAECTDTTKLYVLPDGYIYAYKTTTATITKKPTNRLLDASGNLDLQVNKRWSLSGAAYKDANGYAATAKIAVNPGQTVRVNQNKSVVTTSGYTRIHYFDANDVALSGDGAPTTYYKISEIDGGVSWVVGQNTSGGNLDYYDKIAYMRVVFYVSSAAITASSVADFVLTLDEELGETTSTETVTAWVSTGRAFVPADYEDRIIDLEKDVDDLKDKTASSFLSVMSVFAPSPQLPADGSESSDFNAETMESQNIYDYMDALVAKYPRFITKETMGKDESDTYDWNRYVCCRRNYDAWQKTNYPKMWAWVNGSTTIYSQSVSPRIGDTMYSTAYIGTAKGAVTAVDNANQTRTVGGVVYARDKAKDVDPTLVFTNTDYSAYYSSTYANYAKEVYDNSLAKIGTISALDASAMTDSNGNSYTRYPLGDRDNNFRQPEVIVIGGSEHGGGEPREPAIIAARMAKDLCECKNADNALLNLLKNNYMVVFCPILNPWGFSESTGFNANGVNLDRNFDTPGWGNDSASQDVDGDYGGSENETQYFMNTVSESKAKIAVANHALGTGTTGGEGIGAGFCHYMLGRNNSKYSSSLKAIKATMNANYNLAFTDYGEAPPEKWGKTRSYIDWAGAEGGAVEMQAYDGFILAGDGNKHTARIMEADYTLALQFLHMLIKNANQQ